MPAFYKKSFLFDPEKKEPFRLSRTKLELFINCPRCFYLDRRLGISRPSGPPFTLNSAVDKLLKKEFDIHRAKSTTHPLLKNYHLDLVPFNHEKINEWRENFVGVSFLHQATNLNIFGAIDDLWTDGNELYVVDYKSTSKNEEITELNSDWHEAYKRQMEIYQWLLRHNDLNVSDTGYFVYCNGNTDKEAFDGRLEFDLTLISYHGNDSWVEPTIIKAHECLISTKIPAPNKECEYCNYITSLEKINKKI
ncbi:MAG TPA: PD-(D/E)XK nuclease family protein [bacterium]|nr:PD-(D/E)XK nuclease family protein [bacterium]HPL95373.1 PD-(D/E)XK nuclease family protein [bacterium]